MKNRFNDFQQNEYDFAAIEEAVLARDYETSPRRYSVDEKGNIERESNQLFKEKLDDKDNFYGMITYVSSKHVEDNVVTFYDEKEKFDTEMEYQKSKKNGHYYGTILTREQFIEQIGNALETSGHYMAIGNALQGDYTQEVADWRANNPVRESIYSKFVEVNKKVTAVYAWEQLNGTEKKDCATTADGHTGQIFIISEKKLEERYAQIMINGMSEEYKYYFDETALNHGSYPLENFNGIKEYTEPIYIPELEKNVLGELVYEKPLPEEVIKEYGLISSLEKLHYLTLPYLEKEEFNNLAKQLKEEGARFDPEEKKWYITPETDKEKIEGLIQSAKEAHQEGREYLSIPYLEKEEFNNLAKQLKEEGARFDPEEKKWYITPETDKEKIEGLIQSAKEAHQEPNEVAKDYKDHEEKCKNLTKMIEKAGYQPTRDLVNNIFSLNSVTKKDHTIADLAAAFKDQLYTSNQEATDLLEKIGKEFCRQEHQREIVR